MNCSYFLAAYIPLNVFLVLSLFLIIFSAALLFEASRNSLEYFLSGLVLGGGLMNFAERLVFGCVSDYINFFDLFKFNLSDVAIVVGVVGMVIRIFSREGQAFKVRSF